MIGRLKARGQRWLSRRIPAAASVRLDQRRIFIIPTRVGAAFALALLLMLLAAINYQNSLAYGLTFMLAAVFIIAILHTYRNLAGLTLTAGGASAVFVGEQGVFRLRLESSARAHQAIALGWPPAALQSLDVPAGGLSECQLNLSAPRRGWLRPGRLRVESRFPLGLLVAWSWVDLDQALLVYPRPLAAERPLAGAADEQVQTQGRLTQDRGTEDFQGLKTYQPGESKRRLHWKAYSRGQGLLIKDFAALSGQQSVLDFDALDGDVETRLSLLCRWVLQLSEHRQSFALHLPGLRLPVASGEGHRLACLRALALFGSQA